MSDMISRLGKSFIQHGKDNDRIYLMNLNNDDLPDIVYKLDSMAVKCGYSKIFAKVPSDVKQNFLNNGYNIEAKVPKFYDGIKDAIFMGKYFSQDRKYNYNHQTISDVLEKAEQKKKVNNIVQMDDRYQIKIAKPEDALEMAEIYKKVFDSYPFPVYDPSYIKKTMADNIIYFGVWDGDDIVALASCEMDIKASNVEMTDFATLPENRGNKFAEKLLYKMEQEMKKRGIKTAYTIARAISYGMNITFAKMGYMFTGTLINNTNISGGIESMNVWYKAL